MRDAPLLENTGTFGLGSMPAVYVPPLQDEQTEPRRPNETRWCTRGHLRTTTIEREPTV